MNISDFMRHALTAAWASGHIWPEYATCEAALESAWGSSHLATECNNLFGQKSGHTSIGYPHKHMPTHEVVNGKTVPVMASWPVFPDWETSFRERMKLLRALPVYASALTATSGEEFVRQVSHHWATDPLRADKCLEIYSAHRNFLEGPPMPC